MRRRFAQKLWGIFLIGYAFRGGEGAVERNVASAFDKFDLRELVAPGARVKLQMSHVILTAIH